MAVKALAYRPDLTTVDIHGDPINAQGQVIRAESPGTYLGELEVVFADTQSDAILPRLTGSGGGSVDRAEAADVSTTIGAPRNAAIKLRNGDRLIVTDDEGYSLVWAIVGPRRFDYPSSVSGWNHKYYWSSAIATDG
jgi:hypothetical protein